MASYFRSAFRGPWRSAVLLFLLLLSFANPVSAQTENYRLWGTLSSQDRAPGNGGIYSVNTDGSDFQILKAFDPNPDGSRPAESLVKVSGVGFVGTTSEGGVFDNGVLFSVNEDGSGFTKLYDFNPNVGFPPYGHLVLASNGYIYGVGRLSYGEIFRIRPDGTDYQKIHQFTSAEGQIVEGLIEGSDGDLYGCLQKGAGSIFRIHPDGSGFTMIYNHGASGQIIEGEDGYLYGSYLASIFKVMKDGSDYQEIHSFGGDAEPNALSQTLVQLADGKLVGCTAYPDATDELFSVEANGDDYTLLYHFDASGIKGLTYGSDGRLYGVGKGIGNEVFFSIQEDGNDYTALYDATPMIFNQYPTSIFLEAEPGQFVGVDYYGGTGGNGSVFTLSSAGDFAIVKDFPQEGADPESELIQGSDGWLYGTTVRGGTFGKGTIFKINKDGSDYTKLFDIGSSLQGASVGRLVELAAGFIFGTTSKKPDIGGSIFKFKPDGSELDDVYDFGGYVGAPISNVVYGSDNKFYGVLGIDYLPGILYSIEPNGSSFTTILDFSISPGGVGTYPTGLKETSDGRLLGMTARGGTMGSGTLFNVDKDGSNITKIRDLDFNFFNEVSHNVPIEGSNGQLIGTSYWGYGVYSMNASGADFNIYFDKVSYSSIGDLIELPGQHIFGTVYQNIFRFDSDSNSFTNLDVLFWNPADKTTYKGLAYAGLLAVEKDAQTLSFDDLASKKVNNPPFSLEATASSGLPVIFSSSNPEVADVSGNSVTIKSAGTTTIIAHQAGTISIAPVEVSQEFVVEKLDQTITFDPLPAKTFQNLPFEVNISASSALEVTLTSSDPSVATIDGLTITLVGAGTASITAKQAGDETYKAAADVNQDLVVSKANQAIKFPEITAKTFGDSPFMLSANSDSELPVQFSVGNHLTLDGTQVTLVTAGKASVRAMQPGNQNFNAASPVEREFCVNPAKPEIQTAGGSSELSSNSDEGNQWYFSGSAISGATSPTYSAEDPGAYTLKVSIEGCASEFSDPYVFAITGVVGVEHDEDFQLYPNPVTRTLTISFSGNGPFEATICGLRGEKIHCESGPYENVIVLDLSNLKAGTYILQIVDAKKSIYRRFIKE